MKILVTGNAGSGKTTLTAMLARELDLPSHGLDSIVWQPGWIKTPAAERSSAIASIIERDAWIVDGVDEAVLEAADVVVFLDVPRWRCFVRTAKRNLPYLFRSRPGLPERCPEVLIIPRLSRIIWNFPARVKPKILSAGMARPAGSFIVGRSARSGRELDWLLTELRGAVVRSSAGRPGDR